MASVEDSVLSDPNFAVICSFFEKFGDLFGISNFTIDGLQHMLEDSRSVHSDLIDLHVKLMRKCGRKNVTHEKWELSLIKYCHCYSKVDAWEIERFGYKKSKLSVKINLLKRLLESQFDRNNKFKSDVNKRTAEDLRVIPIGKDMRGQLYWFQLDADLNLRIYREDQDEESFELVAREREELIALIDDLETNSNLGVKKEEDSTTPSDTGESKDGEISQDVKVSDEKLEFAVTDVKTEIKQENDVDDKAVLASQCSVKKESVESKKDVVKVEKVSSPSTDIKMEVEPSKLKEESSASNVEKPVAERTSGVDERLRVKTESPDCSTALDVDSQTSLIESKACANVSIFDKPETVEETEKPGISSIEESQDQTVALDLAPVGRVSVIRMIHADKSSSSSVRPVECEKQSPPPPPPPPVEKAFSPAKDVKVNRDSKDVSIKDDRVESERSISRLDNVKQPQSVERPDIVTSISSTNSLLVKSVECASTSRSGDVKEKPRTERRTMPLKKREIPKDLDGIESKAENIVCGKIPVSSDTAEDLTKKFFEKESDKSVVSVADIKCVTIEKSNSTTTGKISAKESDKSQVLVTEDESVRFEKSDYSATKSSIEKESAKFLVSVVDVECVNVEESNSSATMKISDEESKKSHYSVTKDESVGSEKSDCSVTKKTFEKQSDTAPISIAKDVSVGIAKLDCSTIKKNIEKESDTSVVPVAKEESSGSMKSDCLAIKKSLEKDSHGSVASVSKDDSIGTEKSDGLMTKKSLEKELVKSVVSVAEEEFVNVDKSNSSPAKKTSEKVSDKSVVLADKSASESDSSKKGNVVSTIDLQVVGVNESDPKTVTRCHEVVSKPLEMANDSRASIVDKKVGKNDECNILVKLSSSVSSEELSKDGDKKIMVVDSELNKLEGQTPPSFIVKSPTKGEAKDYESDLKSVDKCVMPLETSVSCVSSVDVSSKVLDPCGKIRVFDDTGQEPSRATQNVENIDVVMQSETEKSKEHKPDSQINVCSNDILDISKKESSFLKEFKSRDARERAVEERKEDVECISTKNSGETPKDSDLDQLLEEIKPSKVTKTSEEETRETIEEMLEKVASGVIEDDVTVTELVAEESIRLDSNEQIVSERGTSIESVKDVAEFVTNESTKIVISEKSSIAESNSNKNEICEAITETTKKLMAQLCDQVAESKPVGKDAKMSNLKSVTSDTSKDAAVEKKNVKGPHELVDTKIKEAGTSEKDEEVLKTRSKCTDSEPSQSCATVKNGTAKTSTTLVEISPPESNTEVVDRKEFVKKRVATKSKFTRLEVTEKHSLVVSSTKGSIKDESSKKLVMGTEPTLMDISQEEGKDEDVGKTELVKDKVLKKLLSETPMEIVQEECSSRAETEIDFVEDKALKKVVAKKKAPVETTQVENKAQDVNTMVSVEDKTFKKVTAKKNVPAEMINVDSNADSANKMDSVKDKVLKKAEAKKNVPVKIIPMKSNEKVATPIDFVDDEALQKVAPETTTPVAVVQDDEGKVKGANKNGSVEDAAIKNVIVETTTSVESINVDNRAEDAKVDPVEDKSQEKSDVTEPATKKRKRRGRGRVADEDDEEPPAPPKRSSRLQAQRQKYEQEQRLIEEELQRQAMLVQQRMHEEWKKKQEKIKLLAASEEKEKEKSNKKNEVKGKPKPKGKKPPPPPQPPPSSGNGSSRSKKKRNSNPWEVSSESSSVSSYEEESSSPEEVEESEEELVFSEKSDHEFSPESDQDEDYTEGPAKVKRARTVKKVKSDNEDESSSSDGLDDDKPCSKCEKYDHPEWILLCDKCDSGYHTSCLRPPLMLIPDGDWFCPPCDHKMLVEKLREKFRSFDQLWKKKEREEMRKKRLAYVGISLDNVLKPPSDLTVVLQDKKDEDEVGGAAENEVDDGDDEDDDYLLLRKRSRRARKEVSYRFKEFDELIDSAIQEPGLLIGVHPPVTAKAVAVSGVGMETLNDWSQWVTQQWDQVQEQHGFRFGEDGVLQETPKAGLATDAKRTTNTLDAKVSVKKEAETKGNKEAKDEKVGSPDDDHEEDDEEEKLVVVRQKKRKHRRLNDLDSPSDDDDSDEDFKGTSSESEVLSEDESGAGAEETDESWKGSERRYRSGGRSRRNRGRRRSDDDFVCDESEESDDNRRTVRRAAARSVNYRELSDSDECGSGRKGRNNWSKGKRQPSRRIESDEESEDSDWKKSKKRSSQVNRGNIKQSRKSRVIDSDDDDDETEASSLSEDEEPRKGLAVSRRKISDDSDSMPPTKKKSRMNLKDFELESNEEGKNNGGEEEEEEEEEDDDEEGEGQEDEEEEEDDDDDEEEEEDEEEDDDDEGEDSEDEKKNEKTEKISKEIKEERLKSKVLVESAAEVDKSKSDSNETRTLKLVKKTTRSVVGDGDKGNNNNNNNGQTNHKQSAQTSEEITNPPSLKGSNKQSVIKSVESVKKEILKQTKTPPKSKEALDKSPSLASSAGGGDSAVNRPRPFPPCHPSLVEPMLEEEREEEGSLQKLETLAKGPNADEPSYSERLRPPDYQNRPSPLKPSAIEPYPARSSPSKLTLLDTYPSRLSPQPKLTPLEPYSAGGSPSPSSGVLHSYDRTRPPGPLASHYHSEYGGYPPSGPGQYYPQNYPPPPPSGQYSHSPPMGGYHHSPNPYPQFHHHQHSPNYNYMPPGYNEQGSAPYQGPTQPPYGSYGNYSPQANNQQPPPSTQPNGRFSIDNLLQRRIEGAAGEDDDFSTVNDLVSYITGSHENPL